MTQDQRDFAYQKSLQLRRDRAALKAQLSRRQIGVEDAFDHPAAQGMKVRDLLTALPGWGPVRAAAVMTKAGIDQRHLATHTVRQLGHRQREKLLKLAQLRMTR